MKHSMYLFYFLYGLSTREPHRHTKLKSIDELFHPIPSLCKAACLELEDHLSHLLYPINHQDLLKLYLKSQQ